MTLFVNRQIHSVARSHTALNNRNLVNGVLGRQEVGNDRVARLVISGHHLVLIRNDMGLLLCSHYNLNSSLLDFLLGNRLLFMPYGKECRFI